MPVAPPPVLDEGSASTLTEHMPVGAETVPQQDRRNDANPYYIVSTSNGNICLNPSNASRSSAV